MSRNATPTSPEREEERKVKRDKREERRLATERAMNAQALRDMVQTGRLHLGNDSRFKLEWVSTGIPDLDRVLGGGMPRGRITIMVGDYSSAKTFLSQMTIKQAITQGLTAAYIDTERSYDPAWWAQVGIPVDKVYVSQPAHGEAAVDVMVALARANVDVIVMDSLAALIPMEEATPEAKAENKQMGLQARLIGKLMRMLMTTETHSVMLMANQVRETIGIPAPGINMPGGRAPRHYSSIILRLQREGWIEEEDKRVGFHLRVVAHKNKVARPFGDCLLPFHFRGEIDLIALLVDRAIEAGIIEQRGPWFTLTLDLGEEELPIQQGRNKIIELLKTRDDLRQRVTVALEGGLPDAK